MNILTFGSCMSRFTANQYCKLFGGQVVSSVYQNRSDFFVGNHIDKSLESFTFQEIEPYFFQNSNKQKAPEFSTVSIIKDQLAGTLGLHQLSKKEHLFSILEKGCVDIIVADNFVDIGAKLMFRNDNKNKKIFLRQKDINNFDNSWGVGELISPDTGAEYMSRILSLFRGYLPNAYIMFINFPYNTYMDSPRRVERTKAYQSALNLKLDRCMVLESLDIPLNYQTHERQHYKKEHYSYCAGILFGYINRFGNN